LSQIKGYKMVKRERLYDAFGELVYAMAKADGEIQAEEIQAMELLLKHHPWAKQIKWSFDYENLKHHSVEEAYIKAVEICKENGPDPEYKYLIDLLTAVASAVGGIVPQEKRLLHTLLQDLRARFIEDFRKNQLGDFD